MKGIFSFCQLSYFLTILLFQTSYHSIPSSSFSLPLCQILFKTYMHRSELIPGKLAPQKNVSGASDNSKQLSKSSVSSKCLPTEQSLQGQIVQLKQKAHQSFMQVIQMQQLHEEELEQLREEFSGREQQFIGKEEQFRRREEEFCRRQTEFKRRQGELESRVTELQKTRHLQSVIRASGNSDIAQNRAREWQELQVRVKQLQFENATLQKNYKHHICEFQQDELQIDNIELITCRQESRLDDSAIINFRELVNMPRPEEHLMHLKEQARREVELLAGRQCSKTPLGPILDRIFDYASVLRSELAKLQQRGEKEKERQAAQSKDVQSSKFYQSLQRETKFMADHIKRLSAEKLRLEKRLQEVERESKAHEERLRKVDASLARRGIKLAEVAPPPPQDEKSLEINEFISETFKTAQNPTHRAQYGLLRKTKN